MTAETVNKRKRDQEATAKALRTHRHELATVIGNNLICKCGKLMGFLRDPRSKR